MLGRGLQDGAAGENLGQLGAVGGAGAAVGAVVEVAGALAGVGAGLYYLSTVAEWNPQVSTALPALGFNGISAALLACSNPIGTIFSSLFISYITVGGTKLSTQYYTKEIADVIRNCTIYKRSVRISSCLVLAARLKAAAAKSGFEL